MIQKSDFKVRIMEREGGGVEPKEYKFLTMFDIQDPVGYLKMLHFIRDNQNCTYMQSFLPTDLKQDRQEREVFIDNIYVNLGGEDSSSAIEIYVTTFTFQHLGKSISQYAWNFYNK